MMNKMPPFVLSFWDTVSNQAYFIGAISRAHVLEHGIFCSSLVFNNSWSMLGVIFMYTHPLCAGIQTGLIQGRTLVDPGPRAPSRIQHRTCRIWICLSWTLYAWMRIRISPRSKNKFHSHFILNRRLRIRRYWIAICSTRCVRACVYVSLATVN